MPPKRNNKGKAAGSGTVSNVRKERYRKACAERDRPLALATTQDERDQAYLVQKVWRKNGPPPQHVEEEKDEEMEEKKKKRKKKRKRRLHLAKRSRRRAGWKWQRLLLVKRGMGGHPHHLHFAKRSRRMMGRHPPQLHLAKRSSKQHHQLQLLAQRRKSEPQRSLWARSIPQAQRPKGRHLVKRMLKQALPGPTPWPSLRPRARNGSRMATDGWHMP